MSRAPNVANGPRVFHLRDGTIGVGCLGTRGIRGTEEYCPRHQYSCERNDPSQHAALPLPRLPHYFGSGTKTGRSTGGAYPASLKRSAFGSKRERKISASSGSAKQ